MGFSPFYMVHSIKPTLPFDITMATFLVPNLTKPLPTDNLIAIHTRQLEKRPANLAAICDWILASCFASTQQFKKQHSHTIHDFDFALGTLVLVHNMGSNMDKMKPCYLGPMIVLWHSCNGAYRLGELDSAISRLCYAAFQLLPYHARSHNFIPVTHVVDSDDVKAAAGLG